ncbi:MAG: RecX family transcriptional regulator [Caldimonas sp.]
MPPRRSLKSRALQLLAQRDQSRVELRRKLLRHARSDVAVAPAGDDDGAAAVEQVEALLDWLEANRFLSSERFVESRVHAREARFGNQRIRSELAQHALVLPPELAAQLADSEMARASAVRERRFPASPRDAGERAAQSRFLAARGFSPELVHRLMRQLRMRRPDDAASDAEAA